MFCHFSLAGLKEPHIKDTLRPLFFFKENEKSRNYIWLDEHQDEVCASFKYKSVQ